MVDSVLVDPSFCMATHGSHLEHHEVLTLPECPPQINKLVKRSAC